MIKFNDDLLYDWKNQFAFTEKEQQILASRELELLHQESKDIFHGKYDIELQNRFFSFIKYSHLTPDTHRVSFDTCATNLIDKLFSHYVDNNTLIVTSRAEHPSVVDNLNKYPEENIFYIDETFNPHLINSRVKEYDKVFIYVCGTPSHSSKVIENPIIESIIDVLKRMNKQYVCTLDDVQGMFYFPRDYRIFDYVIGTAHAVIPGFNLGFVITRMNDELYTFYSNEYENHLIECLDIVYSRKDLLLQYAVYLSQYYWILNYYPQKFQMYNSLPWKFFIIDKEKTDNFKAANHGKRSPMFLIATSDVPDDEDPYSKQINLKHKEISSGAGRLYYHTGLLRASLSVIDFDGFLEDIHKMNMIIETMI